MFSKSLFVIFLFSILILTVSFPAFSQVNTEKYLRVTSPNGGEKWEAKSIHAITWESRIIFKNKNRVFF